MPDDWPNSIRPVFPWALPTGFDLVLYTGEFVKTSKQATHKTHIHAVIRPLGGYEIYQRLIQDS